MDIALPAAIGAKLDNTYPAVAESWAFPDEPYLEIVREETEFSSLHLFPATETALANIANARTLRLLPLLTAKITDVLVVIQTYTEE